MTTDTIHQLPEPQAWMPARSYIQYMYVLNEQARRWAAMNKARRTGQPYLPLAGSV